MDLVGQTDPTGESRLPSQRVRRVVFQCVRACLANGGAQPVSFSLSSVLCLDWQYGTL
eukprot:m.67701 g.67701  ORF g.67701 m.67701 type:complete len:58 (-) comp8458_c0_seq1:1880-2053(-)